MQPVLQDNTFRRYAGIGVAALIVALLIENATWVIGWTSLNGTMTWNDNQMHSMCGSPLVYAVSPSQCSTANGWYTFSEILFVVCGVMAFWAWRRAMRLRKQP
jgi:hypothetical protein